MMNAPSCLVTGGTGCLGTPLVELLCSTGWSVRVLALESLVYRERNCTSIVGSVHDVSTVERACRGVDVVFHLAARVHERRPREGDGTRRFEQDVLAAGNIARACASAGVRRLVFASSIAVYGLNSGQITDATRPNPRSEYGAAKLLAESEILKGRTESVVLRFPLLYGPLDRGNVARLLRAIRRKYFVWTNEGENRRAMIASRNAAGAALAAATSATSAGQTLMPSDGRPISLREVVDVANRWLGRHWAPPNLPTWFVRAVAKLGDAAEGLTGLNAPLNSEAFSKLFEELTVESPRTTLLLGDYSQAKASDELEREMAWLFGRSTPAGTQ